MIIVSACLAGVICRYDGGHHADEKVVNLVKAGKAVVVCPEVLGGLPVPRKPAEISGDGGAAVLNGQAKVIDSTGSDVTEAFISGAHRTLALARELGADVAILKEGSPSCGSRQIYDGTFQGNKGPGMGVTAALLMQNGIKVVSEGEL